VIQVSELLFGTVTVESGGGLCKYYKVTSKAVVNQKPNTVMILFRVERTRTLSMKSKLWPNLKSAGPTPG
jgi:hypothetical protein